MGYLTIKLVDSIGNQLVTDTALDVFIPIVRAITATLERVPRHVNALKNYRVYIQPIYLDTPVPVLFYDIQENELQHLRFRSIDSNIDNRFREEVFAYYYEGYRDLCAVCPEQNRCPGSNKIAYAPLDDWIAFEPNAAYGKSVVAFGVRLVSEQGKQLFNSAYKAEALLRSYIKLLTGTNKLFSRDNPIKLDVAANMNNPPNINPEANYASFKLAIRLKKPQPQYKIADSDWDLPIRILNTEDKIDSSPATNMNPTKIPEQMVNWDDTVSDLRSDETDIPLRVDIISDSNLHETTNPADLPEINLLGDIKDDLPEANPRQFGNMEAVGEPQKSDLKIYVTQRILDIFAADNHWQLAAGILFGQPFLDSETEADSVLISELVVLPTYGLSINSELLQAAEEKVHARNNKLRMVGWYRVQNSGGVSVYVPEEQLIYKINYTTDTFTLSKEEQFIHTQFFNETWQVALIFSSAEKYAFYRTKNGEIELCDGFYRITKWSGDL